MVKFLIFLNIIFGIFTSSKFFLIRIGPVGLTLFRITLLTIMVMMVFTFFYKNPKGIISIPKNNYYSIFFLFTWFIWGIFSVIWVKDYGYWFESITYLGLGFILSFIYSQYLTKRSDYILAVKLFSFMTLFHNIIGWFEILTDNYLFYNGPSIYWYQMDNMPVSSFGNTNDYATFLFLSLSILYVCFKNANKLRGKIFYLSIMISSFYLMISTGSRGAILGGSLSLVAFIILNIRENISMTKVIALYSVIILLFFSIIIFRPELLNNLFSYFTNDFSIYSYIPNDFNDIRYRLILNGLYFLLRTLGLGVGAGNAQYWLATESIVPNSNILYLHNWFLEILVEYGIIIFIMYVIFYYKIFRTSKNIFNKSNNVFDVNFSLSIMIFMAGFLIVSFSSHSLVYHEWFWIYWSIVVSFQWNKQLKKDQ